MALITVLPLQREREGEGENALGFFLCSVFHQTKVHHALQCAGFWVSFSDQFSLCCFSETLLPLSKLRYNIMCSQHLYGSCAFQDRGRGEESSLKFWMSVSGIEPLEMFLPLLQIYIGSAMYAVSSPSLWVLFCFAFQPLFFNSQLQLVTTSALTPQFCCFSPWRLNILFHREVRDIVSWPNLIVAAILIP